jgi:RNA ligase
VTVNIRDLFDIDLLDQMVDGGYVRHQKHPSLPLWIYNYTEKAQYERVWNAVTRTCRGLIVDEFAMIVARPFPKFFNYGEGDATFDPAARVVVTDKVDGSLGIIYPTPDGPAVATRGSFTSEQARHATEVLRSRYAGRVALVGMTPLVEIIYPGNRIVVDYGQVDDLILLGAVHNDTGQSYTVNGLGSFWPGPVAERFPYETLADALAAPPRPGKEGLVVHFLATDERVKIKQADYVALHKIVTGLNARVVWETLSAGRPLQELLARLPDEFHQWTADVAIDLTRKHTQARAEIGAAYWLTIQTLPDGWNRRDFALAVIGHPLKAELFKRLDEADIDPLIWRKLQPSHEWRPSNAPTSEDAA